MKKFIVFMMLVWFSTSSMAEGLALVVGDSDLKPLPALVAEKKPATNFKITSNLASLFVLGDVNIGIEKSIGKYKSYVGTLHVMPNSEYYDSEGMGYRVTNGFRLYKDPGSFGLFFELKGGFTHYEAETDGEGVDNLLSAEFYVGKSYRYNEELFFSYKLGVVRFLQIGEVIPAGGLYLGLTF